MRIAVIIPTYGRKTLLARVFDLLEAQSRLPDEVIVSAPDPGHVEEYRGERLRVSYVFGRQGLAAQRNQALETALSRFDIVTFFDDDFLPAATYLARLIEAFRDNPGWVVVMGHAAVDGAAGTGLSFEEGVAALRRLEASPPAVQIVSEHPGAYGCNMSFRCRAVGATRFDERLALYGWQEDIDFTSQLRPQGQIIGLNTPFGVHLGIKSGRVSGLRFGYSQVVNPVYLIRKGTMSFRFGLGLLGRNLLANAARSISPEAHIDRRGRLKGNLIGLFHLVTGRVEPERILRL